MNLETLTKAGVHFDYCPDAVVPEIPHVQDVLYAMRLTDAQESFEFCVGNHATYIVNVGLVIVAVGYDVLCMEPRYDEAKARTIIARAIIELCPEDARCLFNSAYTQAQEIAGEKVYFRTTSREQLLSACGCSRCKEILDSTLIHE